MSLRLRIVAVLTVLAAAATVAIGVASYRVASRELAQTVDRSLDDAARRFEDGRFVPVGTPRLEPGRRLPAFEQVLWQVITADGGVVSSSGATVLPIADGDLAVAAGERVRDRHDATIDGNTFRVLTVRFEGGALMLARSLEESEAVAGVIFGRTLSAVVVVILVTLLVGWLLARQITRRLERLTAVAGTVASTGRLDVEVPVDGHDETGQLGRAFSSMLDALQRSRMEQRQLVQDAGHELRTPLTSLRTNVSVLRRRFDQLQPDAREQLLADLDSESRELTDLVNELVELAVLGSGDRPDEPVQRVRLGEVAERAAARARRRFGREVTVTADDSMREVRPTGMERAVQNLVDNACKFAPGGPVEVVVSAGTVTVRDHGPGLSETDIPHLFDRFYRSVEMRSTPGSGLGLSIVRSVVEAHGGSVFARNATGGGAEIGFSLPEPAVRKR